MKVLLHNNWMDDPKPAPIKRITKLMLQADKSVFKPDGALYIFNDVSKLKFPKTKKII